MFQTFTGNSRRPRNVNLSGQRNDPFASPGWSPSASGAAQTVSQAAAERQQRRQERQRQHASKEIQRYWRGHRCRRDLAILRRIQLNDLYDRDPPLSPTTRLPQALPLLLASTCRCRDSGSLQNVDAFARDVVESGIDPLAQSQKAPYRLGALLEILLAAIEGASSTSQTALFLKTVAVVVEHSPLCVVRLSQRYYSVLSSVCQQPSIARQISSQILLISVASPLNISRVTGSAALAVHDAFAFQFLVCPELGIVERDPSKLAALIDLSTLATTIHKALLSGSAEPLTSSGLLWLLSHFIALGRSKSWEQQGSFYLETLHAILHVLMNDKQDVFAGVTRTASDATDVSPLPSFVEDQIRSLVDTQGIGDLLNKFTIHDSSSFLSGVGAEAGLLAGFTLTLLRAFPASRDEILMKLFLGNAAVGSQQQLSSIHFLWGAVKNTSLYHDIATAQRHAAHLIRMNKIGAKAKTLANEWKTILLFLELYVFLLRLTDDDDFFGVLNPNTPPEFTQSSRVRQCNFQFNTVKPLTIFLKNLVFSLYYDASEILREAESTKNPSTFLSAYLDASSGGATTNNQAMRNARLSSLTALLGVEFHSFRETAATALRMLYERDSRRPFLPSNHWLMTSMFDMEGFIPAVVAEEKRQQQIRSEGADAEAVVDDDDIDGAGAPFSTRTLRISRNARIEALREQQKRAHRERTLATLGPKLEILRNIPFVIPFRTRVEIFKEFVKLDKITRRAGHVDPDSWRMAMMNDHGLGSVNGRHAAKIRRDHLFDDALDSFYNLGEGLKEPISITFIDQFGASEAGIDGGGVTKEFLTSVTTEEFSMSAGSRTFASNSQNLLYPNPAAVDERREILKAAGYAPNSQPWKEAISGLLKRYEFLGRIVGKCMYEGILIDVAFAGFFLLKWASVAYGGVPGESSYRANLNDLRELDEELYQGLIRLKNYEGDVSDLAQDFTILDQVSLPGEPVRTKTRNLVPNGHDTIVTNENRPLYISYVARHRLVIQPYEQTRAFLKGLGSIIEPSWLCMFNQNELQRLIGGDSSMIDVEDLRNHTEYSGAYQLDDNGEEHLTIKLFWEVMRGMNDSERRDVVKYVTSTPRAPLLGFSQLNPRFTIRDASLDEDRLPSASTCVNLLKLPQYTTKQRLKQKLLYATQSGAGFDLS